MKIIQKTTDYSKFSLLSVNRDITSTKKLENSIRLSTLRIVTLFLLIKNSKY